MEDTSTGTNNLFAEYKRLWREYQREFVFQSEMGDFPYIADEPLVHAVNLAIELGRPLLVQGEPGSGKTQLAESIAYQLERHYVEFFNLHDMSISLEQIREEYRRVYRMNFLPGSPGSGEETREWTILQKWFVKSTSRAQEGLYELDMLRQLRDAQLHRVDEHSYLKSDFEYTRFGALGAAFLMACEKRPEDLMHMFPGQLRTVLLIDEIDKADTDFPNDLLRELDTMSFEAPSYEEGQEREQMTYRADQSFRPIVILTSNSEKPLPDAFLRRCLFHYIKFPEDNNRESIALLRRIVKRNLLTRDYGDVSSEIIDPLVSDFLQIRNEMMQKKPATSELIDMVITIMNRNLLVNGALTPEEDQSIKSLLKQYEPVLPILVKTEEDRKHINRLKQSPENRRGSTATSTQ